MISATRQAWSAIPAPPRTDVEPVFAGWGEETLRTFVGVAPVDVDITSEGFLGCAPLLELRAPAAAAYLGTYILGLLDGINLQERCGLFDDLLTRAHVLGCLLDESFWRIVIRPNLPVPCVLSLVDLGGFLDEKRDLLALTPKDTAKLAKLANSPS
jgi:hypothetical protein